MIILLIYLVIIPLNFAIFKYMYIKQMTKWNLVDKKVVLLLSLFFPISWLILLFFRTKARLEK